jgi:RHS repeat-associated protein
MTARREARTFRAASPARAFNFDSLFSYNHRVNRLYSMSAPGSTCSGLSWSYDQWGNRTAQTVTGGTCGSSQLTFNSYNHVTNSGFQYDAAGNMTHDASHSYTYDAENRVTVVDGGSTATYVYDANGRRVEKTVGGVTKGYLYDIAGNVSAEMQGTFMTAGYVFLGGQMVAEYESGATYFVHQDHLGSTRLLTNVSGGVVDSMDYLPFGEQIAGSSSTTHKFTGYERDAESGLDNAQARYNSSSLGRFMSPDPIGNFVADATNPQTWNLYAYALNNPLLYVDPTGTDPDGSGYNDCVGSGNDPLNCEPEPPPQPCDTNGCIVHVNEPNPPQPLPGPCSGGCVPTNGGGGAGGHMAGESFAQCVKLDGNYFSLQNGLKALTEGKVGTGWFSAAFLGNTFSAGIQAGQDLSNANWGSGTGGLFSLAATSDKAANAYGNLAQSVPNVAVSATVSGSVAMETPTVSAYASGTASVSGVVPVGSVARLATGALKALGTLKTPIDVSVSAFSAVVCSIGR